MSNVTTKQKEAKIRMRLAMQLSKLVRKEMEMGSLLGSPKSDARRQLSNIKGSIALLDRKLKEVQG